MRGYGLALLVGVFLCTPASIVWAQWELMTGIHSAQFEDIDCLGNRCVGVLSNGMVVESRTDSVFWQRFAVLPTELIRYPRRFFAGRYDVELSSDGELFVLAGRLWRFLPLEQQWTEVTRGLDTQGKEIRDMAVWKDGVIAVVTDRHLYMTFSYGDFWWEVKADPSLFVVWGYLENTIQYSDDGVLYFNSQIGGVNASTDQGLTWNRVGNGIAANDEFTRNPLIVGDDGTILAVDLGENVYLLHPETNTWSVIRPKEFNDQEIRIGYGTDGTLLCFFLDYTESGLFPGAYVSAVTWSVDRGKSWKKRFVGVNGLEPRAFMHPEIVTGNSTRVIFSESRGNIWEFTFRDSTLTRRSAPLALSASGEIDATDKDILLTAGPASTGIYSIQYSRDESLLRDVVGGWWNVNNMFLETGIHHFLQLDAFDARYSMGAIRVQEDFHFSWVLHTPYLCSASQFVLNSKDEIIGVDPRGYISNFGKRCDDLNHIALLDNFPGEFISINTNDEFFVAALDGHFKLYGRDQLPMLMGDLPTNEDSLVCICNDTNNNLIVLAGTSAYASHDLGASWQRALLDNDGANVLKVIADRRNWLYLIDSISGIFVSGDRGDSYQRLPLDFDSLDCTVSDITVDSSYVYVSTTGCGVYRMVLPSLTEVREPPSIPTSIAGLNLLAGSDPWCTITVPIELQSPVWFKLSDILGRKYPDIVYTVHRATSSIRIRTMELSAGIYPYTVVVGEHLFHGKIMIRR